MTVSLIEKVTDKHEDYMMDESRMTGSAETISFPKTEEDVVEIIKQLHGKNITIQGGKTGLTGGAVPCGGHLMNLSEMKQIGDGKVISDDAAVITVGPGVTLSELESTLPSRFKEKLFFWPPRPTEPRATVGGVAALDAKGINACHYGDSRQYVEGIHIVKADGTVRAIERSAEPEELDVILGAEGILGPITQLTLRLVPEPENIWGVSFFFREANQAADCAESLRHINKENDNSWISAMEFMDVNTLELIAARKPFVQEISGLPDVPSGTEAMIYVELEGEEEGIRELLMCIAGLAATNGSNTNETWALTGYSEVRKSRAFRHTAPEAVNLKIDEVRASDKRIRKLGTDIEYPDRDFRDMVEEYRLGLSEAGLYGCIFGGVLDSHVHVNIIPKDHEEYAAGRELIKKWTKAAAEIGADPSMEHGIGKLKQSVLTKEQLEAVRSSLLPLKVKYDPDNMFNPGDIFEHRAR